MRRLFGLLTVASLCVPFALTSVGCESDSDLEDAAEETGENLEEAAEEIEDDFDDMDDDIDG
ncbi:MAG: hypothetical protein ACF8PN_13225 [Phycisphaerales bacterium]